MRKKTVICLVSCILIAVAIGLRIYQVNSEQKIIEVEHYAMNEWVDLNGAFLNTDYEKTQGYSLRVKNAQILSYNEYITYYAVDGSKTMNGFDKKSLVCIELEIKNVGNTDGSLLVFECKLIPKRKNTYFIPSLSLWKERETAMDDLDFNIGIKPDSEYTTFVPYKTNILDPENFTEYAYVMTDTSFELVVSNSPIRKVIDITINS